MADLLSEVRAVLEEGGVENVAREAEWLLEAASSTARDELIAERDREISELTEHRVLKLASRRAAGEPLQYLTGVAGFRHLELKVGPGVFIPRPETELVAGRALDRLPDGGALVDIGTGSGAIALAVATERPDARVWATEKSPAAMEWAKRNRDEIDAPVTLVLGHLFNGLPSELAGTLDVVISNPPYVADQDAHLLSADVREHEPHEALFGGLEGLLLVEAIAAEAGRWLRDGGWLVMEIGHDQASKVADLLDQLGYSEIDSSHDLANRDRIVEARWRG